MQTEAKMRIAVNSQEHGLPRTSENNRVLLRHTGSKHTGWRCSDNQWDACKTTAEVHTPSTHVSRKVLLTLVHHVLQAHHTLSGCPLEVRAGIRQRLRAVVTWHVFPQSLKELRGGGSWEEFAQDRAWIPGLLLWA